MGTVLPDVLRPGMKVVFCGTAAGNRSAAVGAYYAGRGNQFWHILKEIGLTDELLLPEQYRKLDDYNIGLTDLVQGKSGNDIDLNDEDYDIEGFRKRIEAAAPKVVAFTSKTAAQKFYGSKNITYGKQGSGIGETVIFVLPSTSGAARGSWDEKYWRELADFLR